MPVPNRFRPLARRAFAALCIALAVPTIVGLQAQSGTPPSVTFLSPRASELGDIEPRDVELADFNGDGYLDLAAITTQGSGRATDFLLGDGSGNLLKDNTLTTTYFAAGLTSGDFNADGILDLAVTQDSNKLGVPDPACGLVPGTIVFLGLGGAAPAFQQMPCLQALDGAFLNDAAAADFDGDGRLDLAVGDSGARGLRVYRGNGDGTFQPAINATGSRGISIKGPFTAADVNHDGALDLIAHMASGGMAVFIGSGTGLLTFSAPGVGSALLASQAARAVAVADLNADGHPDVVGVTRGSPTLGGAPQNYFFSSLGTASGTSFVFGPEAHLLSGIETGTVAVADFNKDGTKDAVVLDRSMVGKAFVFLGRGDGTFAAGPAIDVGIQPLFALAGDWNSDNWTDIAIVDRNPGNQGTAWLIDQVPGIGDATSPDVALTAPLSGSSLQGTVAVQANASDASGISRVEFYRDNVFIGLDTAAPFEVSWDTRAVPNGPHSLRARAYDSFDNPGTSAIVSITVANVDSTPPNVSVVPPAGLLSGVTTLSATASDANGVARVEFLVGTSVVGSVTAAPYDLVWDTGGFPAGHYLLSARAYDSSNNAASSSPVPVTVDQLPLASAGAPQSVEATSTSGASVTLTGSATDPDPLDTLSYSWSVFGQEIGTDPSISVTFPLGLSPVQLVVTDSFGGSATDTVLVEVIDTTPPIILTPVNLVQEATGPSGANVTFVVTGDDIAAGTDVAIDCDRLPGSLFPFGTTLVTCTATDWADNVTSASFTVIVRDTTPPAITITSPGAGNVQGTVAASASASDAVGVVNVEFYVDTVLIGTDARPSYDAIWNSRTVADGSHTLRARACDAVGNCAEAAIAILVTNASRIVVSSVTASHGSPVGVGTPVTWTVSASGGTGALEYQFWHYSYGNAKWTMARPYSGDPTYTWTPSTADIGAHALQVWVRTAGSQAIYEAYLGTSQLLVIGSTPASVLSLTTSATSPVPSNAPLTWKATASGGAPPLQYEFWRYCMASPGWTMAQPYSTSPDYTWTPQPADAGMCYVRVRVRSSGSSVPYESSRDTAGFMVIGADPISISAFTVSPGSSIVHGTPVTWTASAAGGVGPLEYQFWRYSYSTSTWSIVRDYDTDPTFTWAPASTDVGQYVVHVRVRSAGKLAFEAYRDSALLTVSDGPPVSIASIAHLPASPVLHGTPINWTASATGGTGTLEYEFWRYCMAAPGWIPVQAYSPLASYTFTPQASDAGMCYARVRVRSQGSTVAHEATRDSSGVMVIGANPITIGALADDQGGNSPAGTSTTWAVSATGGTGPLEYQFWRYSYALGAWAMVRDYAQDPTYTWTPNVGELGQHVVHVRVRSAGKLAFEAYREAKVMVY